MNILASDTSQYLGEILFNSGQITHTCYFNQLIKNSFYLLTEYVKHQKLIPPVNLQIILSKDSFNKCLNNIEFVLLNDIVKHRDLEIILRESKLAKYEIYLYLIKFRKEKKINIIGK